MADRLSNCNPAWIGDGAGIGFDAPNGRGRITVFFANPLPGATDRGPTEPPYDKRWTRTGETFDALTLQPSIDAYEAEVDASGKPTGARKRTIWHGFITNGDVT